MAHQDLGVLWASRLWSIRASLIEKNTTPLHLAAKRGNLECVRLLLDRGANVNAMDSRQQSPVYLAAREGHPECMMMLLQNSGGCPDVLTPTSSQDTALIQCFRHGEKMRDCIKELVYRGADVSHCNRDGMSAVHAAMAYDWDTDMMKLLILEGRGMMDFDRTEGGSPLCSLLCLQIRQYRNGTGFNPPAFTDEDERVAIFFLRMGVTRRELKKVLLHELSIPKPPGDLLETLMNSFGQLPSLSELETYLPLEPEIQRIMRLYPEKEWVCSGVLWHGLDRDMTEEARRQIEESLRAIVAEKKRYYQQRSTEVPSLAHLSRAAIRSHLQADVRKVISWPVPEHLKSYILLDHDL